MTTIYVWCNSCRREWHEVIAMGADGQFVGSHVCSDHGFIAHDMGFTPDGWKRDTYDRFYPDGWVLLFVEDPTASPSLMDAYKKNQELAGAQKNKPDVARVSIKISDDDGGNPQTIIKEIGL